MIDSHVLVGSCAQIGKRVHLSAGVQIGGVLEPIGAMPVIVEDDVLVGGNTGLYEGAVVKARAVIGAGTILTGSTPDGKVMAGRTCNDWTSEASDLQAQVGHSDGLGPGGDPSGRYSIWNSSHENGSCANTAPRGGAGRIYCFAAK